MKWWQGSSIIDEMWIGLCIVLVVAAIAFSESTEAGVYTVAGTAIGALGVYLGLKPVKKNGGQNDSSTPEA